MNPSDQGKRREGGPNFLGEAVNVLEEGTKRHYMAGRAKSKPIDAF